MDLSQKTKAFRANNLGLGKSRMFFTSRTRKVFIKLRQTFVEAPILNYFDPKYYIQMEKDISGYAISEILSQLTLDNLRRWHLVVFFFRKIIPIEI